MDVYDSIALTIEANDGKIRGRTAIQKLIYFHTVKIPNLDICSYRHYFYGPFSREVASALEDMSAFSYLNEIAFSGLYDSYSYELTTRGKEYANKGKNSFTKEYEAISDTVKTCQEFCELKSEPLSCAAKAYYILTHTKDGMEGKYTNEDVTKVAKNFDWDISNENIDKGISLLQKLSLVQVS